GGEGLVGIEARPAAGDLADDHHRSNAEDDGDDERRGAETGGHDADLLEHDVAPPRPRMQSHLHHGVTSSVRNASAASSSASGVTSRTVAPVAARRAVTSRS